MLQHHKDVSCPRSITPRRRALVAVTSAALLALITTSCASNTEVASNEIDDSLVAAAEAAALKAAGGEEIGGELDIVGVNGGTEGEIIASTFEPFEAATGIKVNYNGTSDANTVVQTGVSAGDPPDIFNAANAGSLPGYAEAGELVPLDDLFDAEELNEIFDPALIESATWDGSLYGIWNEVDNFMIWYNSDTYDGPEEPATWAELGEWTSEQAASGSTPWCMGLENGAASGVQGAHFINAQLLTTAGADKLAQLSAGELPFTSPEVKDAFEQFGAIVGTESMVDGGATGALATKQTDSGNGLFSDPQRCSLLGWGNYAANLIAASNPEAVPGENLKFFKWPAVDEQYAGAEMVSGHVMYAFNDTPQVQAFMRYYASAEAQALLAASGQWVVANRDVSLDTYPNETMRAAAEQYEAADDVVLSPVAQLPGSVVLPYYKAVVAYVQDPASLDAVLQTVEDARLTAIGG